MNTQTLDKIGASTAAATAIGLTQEMVRIDSTTNGKEDALAHDLGNAAQVAQGRQSLVREGAPRAVSIRSGK